MTISVPVQQLIEAAQSSMQATKPLYPESISIAFSLNHCYASTHRNLAYLKTIPLSLECIDYLLTINYHVVLYKRICQDYEKKDPLRLDRLLQRNAERKKRSSWAFSLSLISWVQSVVADGKCNGRRDWLQYQLYKRTKCFFLQQNDNKIKYMGLL